MVATRGTLPIAAVARDLYTHHCPTCGSVITRDGRRGWRNMPHACSSGCFAMARQAMVSKRHFVRGGGMQRVRRSTPQTAGPI